jgi:hypothetical protein
MANLPESIKCEHCQWYRKPRLVLGIDLSRIPLLGRITASRCISFAGVSGPIDPEKTPPDNFREEGNPTIAHAIERGCYNCGFQPREESIAH